MGILVQPHQPFFFLASFRCAELGPDLIHQNNKWFRAICCEISCVKRLTTGTLSDLIVVELIVNY